ncbi:membrane protein [Tamlana nanhaiensis]|uniref:Membrane protein n=1 Tax=Neotamlana nanhaiensis TaxID=1382798 RepID=A0A0D7VW71_9FLAO|nr:membrane protein [Tamlana nanhaiensis]KJD31125.1 membrane protein [Tamlana nanhaiensis]
MIKKLVLVFIAVVSIYSYGQEGSASPYSFYGIGNIKFKGTAENRSMGGLSVYTDSVHVNLRNPASYASDRVGVYPFNGESSPVKFAVGGNYSSINLKSETGNDKTSSATFDYLAIAVPVGKFGIGFGLLPYSSVGYRLDSYSGDDDDNIQNRFRGEGGLNKVFAGVAYQVMRGLSIGVDFQYSFGNIKNSSIAFLYDSDGTPIQYQSREDNRSDLSGLNLNFGATYKTTILNDLQLSTAVTYAPESLLGSKNERSFSTIAMGSNDSEIVYNTIDVDLDALGLQETDLILPSRFSAGFGIGKPRKWFVGTEYVFRNTSNLRSSVTNSSNPTNYEDATAISFGGFYIPQYNAFNNFFKRVVYRAGMRYEKTGIVLNNESIKEFGISFGVGIPVGDSRLLSNANLGAEFGKRGTTNNSLIQENFVNVQLSLSLNDRWFEKRKYD